MDRATYACTVAALFVLNAYAQTDVVDIVVKDSRPVSAAIKRLSEYMDYVVTYEDPRYEFRGDLRDATAIVRPNGPNGPRIFWPAESSIEMKGLQLPNGMDIDAASQTVEKVLEVQNRSNTGGKFKLIKTGRMLHIVPSEVRNKQGRWIPQNSLLDVYITIPKMERTTGDMVNEICKEVSRTTGMQVIYGDPSTGGSMSKPSVQGADNEVARDVLMRTLAGTGQKMAWNLLYVSGERWSGHLLYLSQLTNMSKSGKQSDPAVPPRQPSGNGPMPGSPRTR